MIWWLVVLPAVLLLLALGVANWKFFHFAYCRHLLRSGDQAKQGRALLLIHQYKHLPLGMSTEEVKARLAPLKPRLEFLSGKEYVRQDNSLILYPPPKADVIGRICWYDCHPQGTGGPSYRLDLEFHDDRLVTVKIRGPGTWSILPPGGK